METKLRGVIPAMITPFTPQNAVDEEGIRESVNYLVEEGAHGLCPLGGTGEFQALSNLERKTVVDTVVDETNGRVPVIIGSLSPGFSDSIELIRYAEDAGADAILQITPYYLFPLAEQSLYDYFKTIAEMVDIPILLYNIPYRTGNNLTPSVISKLAGIDNIVGIKQCNRDIMETFEVNTLIGDEFVIFSGEDDLFYPLLTLGMCKGGLIASANLVPHMWVQIFEEYKKGNICEAKKIYLKLLPLLRVVFAELNPGPLKEALSMAHKPAGPVRMPLLLVKNETKEKLQDAMKTLELI